MSESGFKNHVNSLHFDILPFTGSGFVAKKTKLQLRAQTIEEELSYICQFCDDFKTSSYLELTKHKIGRHCLQHLLQCDLCENKFLETEQLSRHKFSYHCQRWPTTFVKCSKCKITFAKENDFLQHVEAAHQDCFQSSVVLSKCHPDPVQKILYIPFKNDLDLDLCDVMILCCNQNDCDILCQYCGSAYSSSEDLTIHNILVHDLNN